MSQRTDMAFGRQGGRIVDGAPTDFTNARSCDECGELMLGGQYRRHHLCDAASMVGRSCSCPPGCTDVIVGDQDCCDPRCEPCTLRSGETHANVTAWKRKKASS